MDKQPSAAAKGCAFALILLAVFGGGTLIAMALEVIF